MGTKHRPDTYFKIANGTVVTAREIVEEGVVIVAGDELAFVGPASDVPDTLPGVDVPTAEMALYDAQGGWICPGFVDVHVHGGAGADTMDATPEALETIARLHGAHGTTAMLATTMTESYDKILQAARTVREMTGRPIEGGAQIVGMHLEGPYIHPSRVGAQNPAFVRDMNVGEFTQIHDILGDAFRLTTIAAERPGGLDVLRFLRRHGVVASLGHTDASYEEATALFNAGVTHVTHMYNAMTPLHHRNPGVVGAAMLHDGVLCELIADGIHLHPAATRLVWAQKRAGGACLVTDAMAAAGMPEGEYTLGGQKVIMRGGSCRLTDGTLAGSVLTMDRAVAHMVQKVGVPVLDAVRMASLTPATAIGIDSEKGSLVPGKDADIVVLSPDFQARATWVEGRLIHRAD